MSEVSKEDIIRLARHAFEGWRYDVEHGRNAYNECPSCGGSVFWNSPVSEITHRPDCLKLFAKRILESLGEKAEFSTWSPSTPDADEESSDG
jgi:hypothetical protein